MPLTDQEILDRAVAHLCADARLSPSGRHGDYFRRIVSQAMTDATASTRQQLSALRDELLADSEKAVASSGEGSSPTMIESFHRGRSASLYGVLGKLAEILKGTP